MGIFQSIKGIFKKKADERELFDRDQRFRIFKEMSHFHVECEGKRFHVLNVSTTGIALEIFEGSYSVGQKIELKVFINKEFFVIDSEVVRVGSRSLALKYLKTTPEFMSAFIRFLDIERRSAAMSSVNPELIKQDKQKGSVAWYRGGKGDELFYSYSEDCIHHVQIRIMNYAFEYFEGGDAKVGIYRKDDESSSYSSWLIVDVNVQDAKEIFGRYLENIEGLPDNHRLWLEELLNKIHS